MVSSNIYLVDHVRIAVGDWVSGYYDGDAPVPLIYPPQYRAIVMIQESSLQNVKADHFDYNLVNSYGYCYIWPCYY